MLRKKIKIAAILSAALLLTATAALTVYAYFTTVAYVYTDDGDKQVAHLGMNLSLLFDKLTETPEDTTLPFQTTDSTEDNPKYYTYNSQADWGSPENPYVISDIRHLQNLSALQDIGYFYDLMIVNNFDVNGNYTANSNEKPYFLVCKNDGTPVTINGTGVEIKPIGNEYYPFIGEIAGAPVAGTTTVPVKGGLSSDTSTIYNITIKSKRERPDHGIFGYVSYLGDMPENYPTNAQGQLTGTFNGYVSRVSGLLMADVSLVVRNENFVEEALDDVTTWIGQHVFSDSALDASSQNSVPHETHHIGILAGHVDYVDIADISVYYSNDEIVCVDLHDKREGVNYFSSTGVVGYIYSMNPTYEGNVIHIGTGSSSVGLGSLGGGGSASGVNPGYVLAAEMYRQFSQFSKPAIETDDGLPTYGSNEDPKIMIYAYLDQTTKKPIFMDEIGRRLYPETADGNGFYSSGRWYFLRDNTRVYLEDTGFFYNQSEVNELDDDGNFVSAPVYYSSLTKVITYTIVDEAEGDDEAKTYELQKLAGADNTAVIAVPPQMRFDAANTNMYLYSAKTNAAGTESLCAQWYRDRLILGGLLGKEPTGRYYFHDGVFTFALSDVSDMIREIWPVIEGKSTTPTIDLATGWETGEVDDYIVITKLVPVKTYVEGNTYMLAYPKEVQTTNDDGTTSTSRQLYFLRMIGGIAAVPLTGGEGSITGMDVTVSNFESTLEFDLGKDASNLFDAYLLREKDGSVVSSSDPHTGLGIYTTCTWIFGWNHSHAPYTGNIAVLDGGGEGENESEGALRYYYSYNANIIESNDKFQVVYTKVPEYSGGYWGFGATLKRDKQRYLTFDATNNAFGTGANNQNNQNAFPFILYELQTEIRWIKSDALVPSESENNVSVPADQYVLYPQYDENTPMPGAAQLQSTDPTYGLINIANLGYQLNDPSDPSKGGAGTWKWKNGQLLGNYRDEAGNLIGLKYIFDLVEGPKYGTLQSSAFGTDGDWDNKNSFVKAKLGTDGAYTYIPMGCISFKVNVDRPADDPIKIRVIVAVPTSATPNGLGTEGSSDDYYFALWQSSLYSGSTETITFSETAPIQKFELPRSQPLFDDDGNRVDNRDGVQIRYDRNGNGAIDEDEAATEYEAYFQGETVLVAYEFTVTAAGVYTIGATNGPMQIVYFSADGVASLGRDGTGGAQLEGIDFVYDNYGYSGLGSNPAKIVTVTTKIPAEQDDNVENYNYYYESGCMLFFDNEVRHQNEYVSIWHEEIYIRRVIDETDTQHVQKTKLSFSVKNGTELSVQELNRYVKCEPYALKHDEVVIRPDDIYKADSSS